MKIAFEMQAVLSHEKTGVGLYAENLIRRVIHQNPRADFVLEYFSSRNTKAVREMVGTYAQPHAIPHECRFPRSVYRSVAALLPLPYRWFFRNNATIRHFFNFIVPPFCKGKKVVTVHDLGFKRFPETVMSKTRKLLRLGLGKSIKRADLVLADSAFTRQEILHFYDCPADKVRVLYAGVDTRVYHPGIPSDTIASAKEKYGIKGDYILYMGTLEPRKNIERLLEAYIQLANKRPDVPPLVLVGRKGWMYDGIFQKITEHGIQERVLFTGYVPEADKPALLSGALFFCFPSLYEGFGLPPLEAMACGTPVLVSDAASLPEVVGDAGLLVDPFSVADIMDGMERLCADAALREAMRTQGIQQAKRFDWDQISIELFQIYKSLEEST